MCRCLIHVGSHQDDHDSVVELSFQRSNGFLVGDAQLSSFIILPIDEPYPPRVEMAWGHSYDEARIVLRRSIVCESLLSPCLLMVACVA